MKRAAWDRTQGSPEPIGALNRIVECESGEPLVLVTEAAPSVRIARPQVIPYVRAQVAVMCEEASRALPPNRHLALIEGWRPLARQQRIYDHFWSCAGEAFPDRPHAALRRTVCRWVAPTDQKAPPGHCTGGAVDVWLVDHAGEPVDVSAPYERFAAAATYSLGLTPEAERERSVLRDAMLGVGFSNCRDEWWHYSWGDAGWAVRTGRRECPYGLAHLDPSLYADLEARHIESMSERTNPFV